MQIWIPVVLPDSSWWSSWSWWWNVSSFENGISMSIYYARQWSNMYTNVNLLSTTDAIAQINSQGITGFMYDNSQVDSFSSEGNNVTYAPYARNSLTYYRSSSASSVISAEDAFVSSRKLKAWLQIWRFFSVHLWLDLTNWSLGTREFTCELYAIKDDWTLTGIYTWWSYQNVTSHSRENYIVSSNTPYTTVSWDRLLLKVLTRTTAAWVWPLSDIAFGMTSKAWTNLASHLHHWYFFTSVEL